jgi:hypothetical protein
VIDMNAPEKDHSASIDYNPEETLPDAVYLMEIPQQGLWLAMPLGGMFKTPPVAASGLTAVSLEAENASVATLPFTALAGVHVSGLVGGALFQRLVEVRGDPLHILLGDPVGHDIGVPRPPYLGSSANPFGEGYQLVAANDSVVLLMPFLPEPVAKDVIDICDRGSHAWRRATLPFTVSAVRAFGPWVTGISTEPRGGPGYGAGRTSFNSSEFAAMRKSPGQEKRASELFDGRHSIDEMFDGSSNYFPGDLVVLNARTDRRLTIHTGEGDSEVVLATDDAAYYRVNDAIFRADLVSGKLSPGTKIAQGPNVPQAHWAFLGPPAN